MKKWLSVKVQAPNLPEILAKIRVNVSGENALHFLRQKFTKQDIQFVLIYCLAHSIIWLSLLLYLFYAFVIH